MKIITNIERLREKSIQWDARLHIALGSIIERLENSLEDYGQGGVGLSAIQIGMPIQIAIIRTNTCKIDIYNPEVLSLKNKFIYKEEGCLSLPGKFRDTLRYNTMTIRNGNGKILGFFESDAVVVQHEIDHFNGTLFTDNNSL